jgi:hypothetical protein
MRFSRERNPLRWLVTMFKRVAQNNPPRKLMRRVLGRT